MKPFAVESRIKYVRNNKISLGAWSIWNKYESARRMLQGLSDMRSNKNIYFQKIVEGEWEFISQYRPVHLNTN